MVRRRRKTMIERPTNFNSDMETEDEGDDDTEPNKKRTKMTVEDENELISVILRHFDEIENKSTDKSLSAKNLNQAISKSWAQIHKEYSEMTGVSVFNLIIVFRV